MTIFTGSQNDVHSLQEHDARLRDRARKACALLEEMQVTPVLIGGCALKAHGEDVDTTDLDFLLGCDFPRLREVAARLEREGYRLDALTASDLGEDAIPFRCFDGGIQIDLIPAHTQRLRDVHARARMVDWSGWPVRAAMLSDVIAERTGHRRPCVG